MNGKELNLNLNKSPKPTKYLDQDSMKEILKIDQKSLSLIPTLLITGIGKKQKNGTFLSLKETGEISSLKKILRQKMTGKNMPLKMNGKDSPPRKIGKNPRKTGLIKPKKNGIRTGRKKNGGLKPGRN